MEESLQRGLAEFIAGCRLDLIEERFRADARYRVLDWIGCAVAGASYPQMDIAHRYLSQTRDTGPCSVFGRPGRFSARSAAFLNGIAGHVCELDDGHRTAIGHPGSITVPVVLALAQQLGSSGADALRAVIIGYDMFARLGRTVNPSHYRTWHTTGTCGTLAAAAAAASILGLSAEQVNNALGIAATMAGGLVESFGTHAKAINIGLACQNGVDAAVLASLGFTGSGSGIMGKKGFVAATCSDPHPENLADPSESGLVSDTAFYKIYSSCGHTNSPLDMVFDLIARHHPDPALVERVDITTYRIAVDLVAGLKVATEDEAKFSLPFCVALALTRGCVALSGFSAESRSDAGLLDLARRVSVTEDPEATARFPHRQATVRITMRDGQNYEARTTEARDKAEPAQIEAKFAAATPDWNEARRREVISFVTTLERQDNVAAMIERICA